MFFNFGKKKRNEDEKKAAELEIEINKLKYDAKKEAENVTLSTRKVNAILYEKSEDIVLNIYLATGGDRR